MDYLNGIMDIENAQRILKKRDHWTWLEMDTSTLAGILIKAMVVAYPKTKFILTVRDVYSWCDSWLDHNINFPVEPSSPWMKLDKLRLKSEIIKPTKYDAPLLELGQLPLACYFQLWQSHNQQVLETVPDDRLLIIKTKELIDKIPVMAQWLGIPDHKLNSKRGWLFAATKKHRTLAKLDSSYVNETAEAHCGSLMQQFFPDTTLQQVLQEQTG